MEYEILFVYTHPGPTVSLRLCGVASLEEFNRKLVAKGVLEETILSNMFYKVPAFPECVVASEEDWDNMIFHLTAAGLKIVNTRSGNSEPVTACLPLQNRAIASNSVVCSTTTSASLTLMPSTSVAVEPLVNVGPQIDLPHQEKKNLLSSSWANYIVGVHQQFSGGVIEFQSKLVKFSIETGRMFKFLRNSPKQVIAECAYRELHNCEWFINATRIKHNHWFCIRVYRGTHICPMEVRSSKRLSSAMIALLIVDMVKVKPSLNAPTVVSMFERDYGIDVSYKQALRGIEKARDFIYGKHLLAYNDLKWQLHHLKELNEGSHIEFESRLVTNAAKEITTNRFYRCFVAFEASIEGFQHCRPFLSIDGTFLSGRYEGVLLAATAKDGDNGLFPVAFAVVVSENKENWKWFLEQLLEFVPSSRDVIYVSDRNTGLVSLFDNEFSYLTHFYCLHHLKMNLRDRFRGASFPAEYKESAANKLSECAQAPTPMIFAQKLEELRKYGVGIINNFLEGLPFEKWAFCYAPCQRFGEMTSNASESYNNWIKVARELPITQCVDLIRAQTMEWFHIRRSKAACWRFKFCPEYQTKWDVSLQEGKNWHSRRASTYVFEFLCSPTVTVNLLSRQCDCYGWQFSGFPCSHGIMAITLSKFDVEDYVDVYYFTSSYQKCYEGIIFPVPTMRKFTHAPATGDTVFPPDTVRQPGRPPKKRILSRGEPISKRQYNCSRCGGGGHSHRTCKVPLCD